MVSLITSAYAYREGVGNFRLCSSRRYLPFLRKLNKREITTTPRGGIEGGKRSKITNIIFKLKFIIFNVNRTIVKWHLLKNGNRTIRPKKYDSAWPNKEQRIVAAFLSFLFGQGRSSLLSLFFRLR
jgi:hypothetical protein